MLFILIKNKLLCIDINIRLYYIAYITFNNTTMKAYIFKSDYEKNRFYSYFSENRSDIDMFELSKCIAVRITLNGNLHLIKNVNYRDIEIIDSLDELICMCN